MRFWDVFERRKQSIRELVIFAPVYFFLSVISLRDKLLLTPDWFDGTLRQNHLLLLQFQYTNNEQSRVLQFVIPEFLRWLFALNIRDAYILQRWLFTLVALVCLHFYLGKWFRTPVRFAGVLFVAAILPLAYQNELQESFALLQVTFLAGLWAIRDNNAPAFVLALLIGALNNETTLALPIVYLFYNLKTLRPTDLARTALNTLLVSLPAALAVGILRFVTRDRPHLGGAWHWPDNIAGLFSPDYTSLLQLYRFSYWYIFIIFGAFWLYAFLRFRDQPLFLKRASLMIPFFVGAHMITGIISEVRQMLPLTGIVVPMALYTLFPSERVVEPTAAAPPPKDGL